MRRGGIFLLWLGLCLLPAVPLAAQSRVELLEGWALPDGGEIIGVAIRLEPGWKTYWRVPGDGGVPPLFDWSASENLAGAEVLWPAPEIFETAGMRSFGYAGSVVFPVRIRPEVPAEPVDVVLTLDFGICMDVCIPVVSDVALSRDGAGAPAEAAAIRTAMDALPRGAEAAGVTDVRCALSDGRLTMAIRYRTPPLFDPVPVFESAEPGLSVAVAGIRREGKTLNLDAVLRPGDAAEPDLSALRLTLIGAFGATELEGCAAG